MGRRRRNRTDRTIPNANREHKDRLFRAVFSDKRHLLDLYNALNGTDYQDVNDLTVNTLEDVLYLTVKNDVSFLLDHTVNLYEHQSTRNPNMGLRGLIYFGRLYDQITAVRGDDLYGSTICPLPKPRYVVFYNGTAHQPDRDFIRLSDAFEGLTEGEAPVLECVATVLNINYGHNRELMEKCRRLEEYAVFVDCVRKYAAHGSLESAIQKAIDECIEKEVLKDMLTARRGEVLGMMLSSYGAEIHERKVQQQIRDAEKQLKSVQKEMKSVQKEMKSVKKEVKAEKQKAEAEKQKAEAEKQKAEAEKQKAEKAQQEAAAAAGKLIQVYRNLIARGFSEDEARDIMQISEEMLKEM